MTPVFGHGNLRLYLLSLLNESPRHGYELIQALTDRFGGTYSPSAGTIYPRLAKLEEEGLVTKTTDGRKTVYEITDAGRAELASRENELDAIEDEVTDSVRRLADEVRAGVREAMRSLKADLASAARDARTDPGASARPNAFTDTEDPARDARQAGAAAVREAEVALAEFRQQLRTDFRTLAARGTIPADAVAQLRLELARARAAVLEVLNRR